MSTSSESILLAGVYTALILGVILWSGTVTEKTIYDRYKATIEGMSVPVTDVGRSRTFYSQVLDFRGRAGAQAPGVNVLSVPPDHKLFLQPHAADARPVEIVMRVRNGLLQLHREFSVRLERLTRTARAANPEGGTASMTEPPVNTGVPAITGIIEQPWGEEFTVIDPDKNRLIFYRPRRKSFVRGIVRGPHPPRAAAKPAAQTSKRSQS